VSRLSKISNSQGNNPAFVDFAEPAPYCQWTQSCGLDDRVLHPGEFAVGGVKTLELGDVAET
jgi:hypothetical protein